MKKLSFSLLFAFLIVGFFAVSAAANSPLEPVKVEPTNRNANQTGVGVDKENNFSQAIKNVEGHKTHGDYQHNTNSCASCHQTHTAKTGSRLLFADTQYQTCVSCHDGTLGFYNVLETGEKASLDGAGTFGGSHANNMSIHMANNSMQIKAAPGGNPNGTNETGGVQWGAQFSCASCHAPHGSYSDRLLHYNPNGFATTAQVKAGNNTFGNYLQNLSISNTQITGNHLRRTTVDGFVKIELFNGANKVVSPWLYGYPSNGQPHFTRLYNTTDAGGNGATRVWYGGPNDVYVNLAQGYFLAKTEAGNTLLNSMTHGHVARPYIVKMDLTVDSEKSIPGGPTIYKTNQAAFWDGLNLPAERVDEFKNAGYTVGANNRTSNLGVQMSQYCATCHTDYFTARSNSGGSYWGDSTKAQRHSTNSDRFSCVRCHYAHGTDAEIMFDADGNTVASLVKSGKDHKEAVGYIKDKNASSALKKYTNMSSCWACHSDSSRATSFKNNDYRKADAHNGMPIVGGVQR